MEVDGILGTGWMVSSLGYMVHGFEKTACMVLRVRVYLHGFGETGVYGVHYLLQYIHDT